MKNLSLFLAILFSILWLYVIFTNYNEISNVIIPFGLGRVSLKTVWLLLGFGLFTCVIDGLSFVWFFKSKVDLNRNYQLKMDKLSVQSDNDKSQVKILENKIKTLEAVIEKLTKGKDEQ